MIARAGFTVGSMSCPHYHLVPKDFDANVRFRREMLQMAGSDPGAAAQMWTMCSEDLLFYCNTFCMTYDPRNEARGLPNVTPFITYEDFQDDSMMQIADCIKVGEDFTMPKSRDMGASWMGLTVFEWYWHFRPSLSFLLVSRNEDYVDKSGNPKALFWKIDFLHEHQPRWLLPTGRWLGMKDPGRRLLHLANTDNKSVIDGESTTGDAGRGDRRTAMFIDEHAAFDLNDGFRVLRATRDTTRCRGFNSTPQGANNAFYEVVHNTAARQIRLHWSKHPDKNYGLYRWDRGRGEPELLDGFRGLVTVFKKGESPRHGVMYPTDYPFRKDGKLRSVWYDNECSRCVSEREVAQELDIDFAGSDYQFFDAEFIELYRAKYCRPPLVVGEIEVDPETLAAKRFTDQPTGNLRLWIPLGDDGRPSVEDEFVLGVDVSAGTGASNSVASVVNRKTGEKIGVLRTPNLRPNPFAELAIALGHFFNDAFMVWDASGPTGKVFTSRVIEHGYGNVYYRRNEKKVTRDVTTEPGYYLNPNARESLLEDYRADLAAVDFVNRSDTGMAECLQFIRKPDGTIEHSASANAQDPSGARTAHGDEVIADALASLGLRDRGNGISETERREVPIGSLAWRMRMREEEKHLATVDTLGEGW